MIPNFMKVITHTKTEGFFSLAKFYGDYLWAVELWVVYTLVFVLFSLPQFSSVKHSFNKYFILKNSSFALSKISKVKSLSHVQLFGTPWTVVCLGIFQARVLEWIAISFSRASSLPRNRTWVSRIAGRRFTV